MSRAKSSNWTQINLPEQEIKGSYPEHVLEEIFGLLRTKIRIDGKQGRSIRNEKEQFYARKVLLRIARELNYHLHQQGLPTPASQRAAIKRVLASAVEIKNSLDQLDPVSREAIALEVKSDRNWNDIESGLPGGDLVKHSVLIANDLERIAGKALKKLPKHRVGRRTLDAVREAIHELRELWSRYQKSSTEKAFLEFVRKALGPVLEPRGIVPGLSLLRDRNLQETKKPPLSDLPYDLRAILEGENERLPEDVRIKLPPKKQLPEGARTQSDADNKPHRQSLEYAAQWNPRARELLAKLHKQQK
jgi:hypothetical protein